MNHDRPLGRLKELFPPKLQEDRQNFSMKIPLELRVSAKTKIVLSTLGSDFLLEIQSVTNRNDGHGWLIDRQILLESEHISELHAYLTERMSEKVQ